METFSWLLIKFGNKVFYLENPDKRRGVLLSLKRYVKLKSKGILPLTIEDLHEIINLSEIDSDPKEHAKNKASDLLRNYDLSRYKKFFPNVDKLEEKLFLSLLTYISNSHQEYSGKVNIFARSFPNTKIVYIHLSMVGFFTPDLAKNVKCIIIPIADFVDLTTRFIFWIKEKTIYILKNSFKKRETEKASNNGQKILDAEKFEIAYVTHKGLEYANLFSKSLFYSEDIADPLFPDRILHLDYSGVPRPKSVNHWINILLKGNELPKLNKIKILLSFFLASITSNQFLISVFYSILYLYYMQYRFALNEYSNLKIAIIDFEILCPKPLLLALESENVITIAVQERYILTFYKSFASTFLDIYLCASEIVKNEIAMSDYYICKKILAVGQYRTDFFFDNIDSKDLQKIKKKFERIVVSLGFHSPESIVDSVSEPLISDKSQIQYLKDMIGLAKSFPNVFFILRFKLIGWIMRPFIIPYVKEIQSLPNIQISEDYSPNQSYVLCGGADLIIAKHTSLGDEALSIGKPVIFYDFTHNSQSIVSDIFDYSPFRIMAHSYRELHEKVDSILYSESKISSDLFFELKEHFYGKFSNGNIKNFIHNIIKNKLKDMRTSLSMERFS